MSTSVAIPLIVGGTLLSAYNQTQMAKASLAGAKIRAVQLEEKAGQERAISQRKAVNVRRQAKLAESRALALAAASGGGASDPTVMNIISGIAGEGE